MARGAGRLRIPFTNHQLGETGGTEANVRDRALAMQRRALVFTKTQSQVPLVEEACRRAGIAVDTLGRGVGRVVADPEPRLVDYPLHRGRRAPSLGESSRR